MSQPLKSLMNTGTKLWLDSIDPVLVEENRRLGISGATSNPIIIANLIRTGRFDTEFAELLDRDLDDHQPLADNRVLDREGRIVKATVIGVGHGLILSGERRGTKAKCCGNL